MRAGAITLADHAPGLALAGCRLVVEGRQLVVLDPDGRELERAGRGHWEWLRAVCSQHVIEHLADDLGLRHELHPQHLWMRLWWPGEEPEAVPWRPFEAALRWLVSEAPALLAARQAQAAQEAQQAQEPETSTAPAVRVVVRLRSSGRRRQCKRRWQGLWRWFVAAARSEVRRGDDRAARGSSENGLG